MTSPGVYQDVVTERSPYYGDIKQEMKKPDSSDKVIDDIRVQNMISVMADDYALAHFFEIKYVVWAGVRWKIDSVEILAPRLSLRMGGRYNGPTP